MAVTMRKDNMRMTQVQTGYCYNRS